MTTMMKRALSVGALAVAIGLPTGAAFAASDDPAPDPVPSTSVSTEDETRGPAGQPDWAQGYMSSPEMRAAHQEHQQAGGSMAGHLGGRGDGRMGGGADGRMGGGMWEGATS